MRTLGLMLLLIGLPAAGLQEDPEVEVEELDRAEIEAQLSIPSPEAVSDEEREQFVRSARFASRYHQIGDLESSLEQLQAADAIVPDHPAILHNLAVVYLQTGRYREAQDQIGRYLDLYPRGAHADQMMSMQIDLDFQKDLQSRVEKTQSYIELVNRASFEFEQGDYESALEKFQQAEELDPEDPAPVFNQAVALEAMGDYQGAREKLRRFLAISSTPDMRSEADRRIFMLEQEISARRADLVCAFCGWRLTPGQYWCPRCWHGPYLAQEARFNTRPCGVGASATRASYYRDGRVALNEPLACLYQGENMLEALRYSRIRQRAIQQERQSDGWSYEDDVIVALEDGGEEVVELEQRDYLRYLVAESSGVALQYGADQIGDVFYLLDEDLSIDGRFYRKHYTYDASGRIVREDVSYRAVSNCGHFVQMSADYVYEGERLARVDLSGEIKGFSYEGHPATSWRGPLVFNYDSSGRVTSEVFTVEEFTKVVTERPERKWDRLFDRVYPGWRRNRPIELVNRADYCGVEGSRLVSNRIDLRPFYSISPSMAMVLENGVARVEVTYTYPSGFTLPAPTAP